LYVTHGHYFMYSPSHAILIAHSHENACFIVPPLYCCMYSKVS
jgi:hypothetical protein